MNFSRIIRNEYIKNKNFIINKSKVTFTRLFYMYLIHFSLSDYCGTYSQYDKE